MRVLVLSRNYPNSVTQLLGLWAKGPVVHSRRYCEPKVMAPVPYCPPLPGLPNSYRKFRAVEHQAVDEGVEVFHPRFLSGPGYSTYRYEPGLYYAAVAGPVRRLWRTFKFDLIHAYFSYPDGVVANRLGRRYGVPVIITDHIPWESWGDRYSDVRRRATAAVQGCFHHISVSKSVKETIRKIVGPGVNLTVIPNSVDGSVFNYTAGEAERPRNKILFAGAVRPIKGADVLLSAVRIMKDRGRSIDVDFVGEAFYESYRREEVRLRQMARDLGIADNVHFLGKKMPLDLARLMENSSVLVLPSRAESFGLVLAEALACGTPVVSTFCGGPEDIVNPQVGVLVTPGDAEALAGGIEKVLDHSEMYLRSALRSYALENFGLDSVGSRLEEIYVAAARSRRELQTTNHTNPKPRHHALGSSVPGDVRKANP